MAGIGGGHIFEMINRLKYNKSLRKSNHFRNLRKDYTDIGKNTQLS
jgi:hypothetical protein